MTTVTVKFELREDTLVNWNTVDPVLASGEPGWDSTNHQLKIGDGTSTWTQLGYATVTQAQLDTLNSGFTSTYIASSEKGAAGGVAELDGNGNLALSTTQGIKYITPGGDIVLSADTSANLTTTADGKISFVTTTNPGDVYIGDSSVAANKVVTRGELDAVISGLHVKDSVDVATTTNIDLTTDFLVSPITIDGISSYAVGDRILVKNQTTATQNGIYVVSSSGLLERAPDEQTVSPGDYTFIDNGTTQKYTGWIAKDDGSWTWTKLVGGATSGGGGGGGTAGLLDENTLVTLKKPSFYTFGAASQWNGWYNGNRVYKISDPDSISQGGTIPSTFKDINLRTNNGGASLSGVNWVYFLENSTKTVFIGETDPSGPSDYASLVADAVGATFLSSIDDDTVSFTYTNMGLYSSGSMSFIPAGAKVENDIFFVFGMNQVFDPMFGWMMSPKLIHSTDAASWTEVNFSSVMWPMPPSMIVDIVYANGTYAIISDSGTILTTSDFITFNIPTLPNTYWGSPMPFKGVYDGSSFVFFGSNTMLITSDFMNWIWGWNAPWSQNQNNIKNVLSIDDSIFVLGNGIFYKIKKSSYPASNGGSIGYQYSTNQTVNNTDQFVFASGQFICRDKQNNQTSLFKFDGMAQYTKYNAMNMSGQIQGIPFGSQVYFTKNLTNLLSEHGWI